MSSQLNRIEEYRARFIAGPVGRWASARGSFDIMMSDLWTFCADGTGSIEAYTAMFGGRVTPFRWRSCGPLVIEAALERDPTVEDDEDDDAWWQIILEFRVITHDLGEQIVMCDAGHDEFWLSTVPLYLVGD